MATFTTTDPSQMAEMPRCPIARMYGTRSVEIDSERVPTVGYIHAIRTDCITAPLKWTIVIEAEKTARRLQKVAPGPQAVETMAIKCPNLTVGAETIEAIVN